jgi:hypothetical protein
MDFVEALDITSLPLVLTQSYQLMVRKCYSSILTERLAQSETYVYTKEDL